MVGDHDYAVAEKRFRCEHQEDVIDTDCPACNAVQLTMLVEKLRQDIIRLKRLSSAHRKHIRQADKSIRVRKDALSLMSLHHANRRRVEFSHLKSLIENQKDMPAEFMKIFNDNCNRLQITRATVIGL